MKLNPLSRSGWRWLLLVFVASCWMSMGVLSECDPAIAGPVVTGVGDAAASVAGTVIKAVFQTLVPEERIPVTTGT